MAQLTVLAVDDDEDDLEIFRETLLQVGQNINLIVAFNGQEALQRLSDTVLKPDVIFLDYNMPLMDGKKCFTAIKNHPVLCSIPIVMHSTSFSDEDIAFYTSLGGMTLKKQVSISSMVKELIAIFSELPTKSNAL